MLKLYTPRNVGVYYRAGAVNISKYQTQLRIASQLVAWGFEYA